MKIQNTKTYLFDELTEEQKEKAIEKNHNINVDYEWWRFVYDDAIEIGNLLGIEIENIYFSGFCSQGDGACFEGSYSYEKGSVKAIKDYAPKDTELHAIADGLQALQKQCFYNARANIKHRGHYYHENCTDINTDFEGYFGYQDYYTDERDEDLKALLRYFMRWIYSRLECEYEYLTSDESVAETLRINGYFFTEDGKIW